MEGCFTFQWGGEGLFFRWGSFLFKLRGGGGVPQWGTSVLMEGGFEKNCRMRGAPPLTMGNPASSLTIVDHQTPVC